MTHLAETRATHHKSRFSFITLLQAIVRADKAFRDKQHLRELPEYLLKDMGLKYEDLF